MSDMVALKRAYDDTMRASDEAWRAYVESARIHFKAQRAWSAMCEDLQSLGARAGDKVNDAVSNEEFNEAVRALLDALANGTIKVYKWGPLGNELFLRVEKALSSRKRLTREAIK